MNGENHEASSEAAVHAGHEKVRREEEVEEEVEEEGEEWQEAAEVDNHETDAEKTGDDGKDDVDERVDGCARGGLDDESRWYEQRWQQRQRW